MGIDPHTSPSRSRVPKRSKWAFFTSVPGILTVVAGLVTTVATIVSQSGNIVGYFRGAQKPASELVQVKLDYPRVFPFGLRHLMGEIAYLKWFHIKIDNPSNERLYLEVSFKVRRGPATEIKGPPVEYTIEAHDRSFERDLDPNIEFTKHDIGADDKLEIICLILDDQRKTLVYNDTTKPIDLLPENVIDWGLIASDGSPVPQDFLLASLTTWTATADPAVMRLVNQLRHGIRPGVDRLSISRWFRESYLRVFHNSSGVQVSPAPVLFPPQRRQTVRTPSQVLEIGEANALEAALLMCALSRATFRHKVQLVLFAAPQNQSQSSSKNILLSWSIDDVNWQAIDFAKVNSMSFNDNEKSATAQVGKLLAGEPEMLAAFKDTGVFLNRSHPVLALNILRADQNYHMTAWQ
jgi:hypothetical protein